MITWKTDRTITNIKKNRYGNREGLHNGYPVIEIKDGWRLIHQLNALKKYELEDIPKGFQVHHLDRDKKNFKFENLVIVHKKDHRVIHKMMKDLIKNEK